MTTSEWKIVCVFRKPVHGTVNLGDRFTPDEVRGVRDCGGGTNKVGREIRKGEGGGTFT